MKKVLLSLAICGLAFSLHAQKAPNLVTVDVNKALAGYARLQDAQVKFEASVTTAREELEAEGEKLRTAAEAINKLQEESENPALNTAKVDEIKKKMEDLYKVMAPISERLYSQNQAQQEAPKQGPQESPSGKDGAYQDADFKIVDDE